MRIKENIRIRKIGDECIMVSTDGSNLNYTRVISLNKSAEFLVEEHLNKDFTAIEWADKLVAKYGINQAQAITDAQELVDKLLQANVLYE